jgi:hypothetical protein
MVLECCPFPPPRDPPLRPPDDLANGLTLSKSPLCVSMCVCDFVLY